MKNTTPMITGTLFPDGVPFDYLKEWQGKPWPKPSAAIVIVGEAIKQGYSVIYLNLENI